MNKFRSTLAVLSFVSATFIFSSCTIDELFGNGNNGNSGAVSLKVLSDAGIQTKSGPSTYEQFETVDLSTEDMDFFLIGTKSLMNSSVIDQVSPITKGNVVTNANINVDGTSFKLNVLKGTADYANGQRNVTYSYDEIHDGSEEHPWTDWDIEGNVIEWPSDNSYLDFWAYKNHEKATITNYSNFSYTGLVPGDDLADAEKMSDFIMAHTHANANQGKPGADDYGVPVHFYHALSAVRFNIASAFIDDTFYNNDPARPNQFKQLRVRVSNIRKDGEGAFDDNADMYYSWTPNDDSRVTYEQILFDRDNKDHYVVKKDGASEYTNTEESEYNRTFFFVPQQLDNVMFTFIFVDSRGKTYELSTKTLGTSSLTPGYIYNYTIGNSTAGNVGVVVKEDPFDKGVSTTKTNVKVGLTKSSAAYIRVAVIANWYASTKVVASYDGEIETGEDWKYNEKDGYYYYKYPIAGYTDTGDLIKNFSCPDEAPVSPYGQLHLEMNIIAQAVTFDLMDGKIYTADWAWFECSRSEKDTENSAWFTTTVTKEVR